MFIASIVCLVCALLAFGATFFSPRELRSPTQVGGGIFAAAAVIAFGLSMFTTVPASHVGVVTTFGKVGPTVLAEGGHFVAPWQSVHKVSIGMDVAAATKSEAGSKDLQSVHADLSVNYHVDPVRARELFILNPSLEYETAFVVPAMYETFKAVVASYTAEELVTKRADVSAAITQSLNDRLKQYHLAVQTVNLVNFGFSRSFDAAIEEKVTASQKAETAKRNLERVKFEADARIAQAEGEARAITIQSAAVEKSGGQGYVQLQAIQKWDGKLPQYVAAGSPVPFVNVK